MEDVEERALATTDIPLRFWKRYVADTCAVLPASRVQEFLIHLNGVEPSIQFTVEMESEGKLPFLDVLLQRDPDGSISTTVYRKATHTDRYLDFMSHHPLAHKRAVVKTVHSRPGAICSDVTARTRRPGTSDRLSSTTATQEECFSTMGHLLPLDPQVTRTGVWPSLFPTRPRSV